ncbi:MAG: acyl-CoA dehydrogenase family protein [Hyphomicrobiales bacterium]|nr:acyl-CoA dehydrogenase family protein [Hyphomicrobiales bacterium]
MGNIRVKPEATKHLSGAAWVAPDCHGMNFYQADPAFRWLARHYMAADLHAHLEPHLDRLGALSGGRLDTLSRLADRHVPVLHPRDPMGRDIDSIEYHPAYKEMERIAMEDFGLNRLAHAGGVLGWPEPMGPLAKYAIQYLFVQSEFGLMCPISATDTSAFLVRKYAPDAVRERYLPRLIADRYEDIRMGAQFMTEQSGGSDVSNMECEAEFDGENWRITGDKFFCSHADGEIVMMLARPKDAQWGSRGLSLFLLPRTLEDGTRNSYQILKLKPKLGSSSMASGECRFDGAVAYLLGEEGKGLKQMLDMVNLSRLSHGVRAAAMMRRSLNEAMQVARSRFAFGEKIVRHPLMRRQLMKIMVPTEQILSVFMFTAKVMERADTGDERARTILRILTPLLKYRGCRDNIKVATAAMEARGGLGYIEDWVNPRLVRDAHLGVLWEGTSNIVSLDVVKRAIPKNQAHEALGEALHEIIDDSPDVPGQYRGELGQMVDRAVRFAEEVALKAEHEPFSRQAAGALYHALSAVLLASEGAAMGAETGDASRLLLSRLVIDHRMRPRDPMSLDGGEVDEAIADLLLADTPPTPAQAAAALAG